MTLGRSISNRLPIGQYVKWLPVQHSFFLLKCRFSFFSDTGNAASDQLS
jgi:hypothetical protein